MSTKGNIRIVETEGYKSIRLPRIVVCVEDEQGRVIRKRFAGRLLIEEMQTDDPDWRWYWSFAQTENDNFACWITKQRGENPYVFAVFESLSGMNEDFDGDRMVPPDIISAVANEIGEEFYQDLDI